MVWLTIHFYTPIKKFPLFNFIFFPLSIFGSPTFLQVEIVLEFGKHQSSCSFLFIFLFFLSFYVEWGGRENEEKISTLEKTIYFQRRENHPH